MKLSNLVTSTLFFLAASQPLPNPNLNSSDFSINLRNVPSLTYILSTDALLIALEAQRDTARAVIDAYNAWDIEAILAYRSPDCEHRVLPASMNRAAKTNEEYRSYLEDIMPLYSNFTVAVMEEIHDARQHKCIIHASSTAHTKIGLYANEYALILTFTEDGTKVIKFDEFVDSAYSEQYVTALAKEDSAH